MVLMVTLVRGNKSFAFGLTRKFRPKSQRTIASRLKPEYLIMIKRRVSEKKRTNAVSIDSPNSASLRLNLFQFFLPLSYGSLGLWSKPFAPNKKAKLKVVLMV